MIQPNGVTNMRAVFVKVYDAAKLQGSATATLVSLLKSGSINLADAEQREQAEQNYKLGRIAGYLSLETREEAQTVLDKKQSERSEKEQLAYRLGIVTWSVVMREAGMLNQRTGEPRQPKKVSNNATPTPAQAKQTSLDMAAEILKAPKRQVSASISYIVPKAKTTSDVDAFALRISDLINAFEKQNPKVKLGGYKAVFDAFLAGVKSLHEGETARAA